MSQLSPSKRSRMTNKARPATKHNARSAALSASKASNQSVWRSVSGRTGAVRKRTQSDPYLQWFLRNRGRLAKASLIADYANPLKGRVERVSKIGPFTIYRCAGTGFLYANPRLKPQAAVEYFCSTELAGYFDIVESSIDFRRKNSYGPIAQFLQKHLPASSRLVEVGCGGGGFLETLRDVAKFDVSGIEIAGAAERHWKKRNLQVHKVLLEEFKGEAEFDIVLMWSVMDHFYDPLAALHKCNQMLRVGGYIFIGNVNTDGFDHQILGFDSATFSPPGRVNYYNRRALARHLELAGFEIVDVATPGVLDVDMVRDYWNSGGPNGRHPFLEGVILNEQDVSMASAFQDFLRTNMLSGYQRVLARKIGTRL